MSERKEPEADKTSNAEDYIRRLVDRAPPLTEEQKVILRRLLTPPK